MGSMMKHVLLTLNMSEEHFLRLEVTNPCKARQHGQQLQWTLGVGWGRQRDRQRQSASTGAGGRPNPMEHATPSFPRGGGVRLD